VLKGAWSYSKPLWAIGVVAALMTAYYMTRLFVLAFTGDPRVPAAAGGRPALHPPHESPWVMRLPLVVLAACAALAGLLGSPLDRYLAPVFTNSPAVPLSSSVSTTLGIVDGVVAVLGLGSPGCCGAAASSARSSPRGSSSASGTGTTSMTRCSAGRRPPSPGPRPRCWTRSSSTARWVGTAVAVRRGARELRRLQNGQVRSYALTIAVGLALLVAYLLARTF